MTEERYLALLRALWVMADEDGREAIRDGDADVYNQWKAAVDRERFVPVPFPESQWRGSDYVDEDQ